MQVACCGWVGVAIDWLLERWIAWLGVALLLDCVPVNSVGCFVFASGCL